MNVKANSIGSVGQAAVDHIGVDLWRAFRSYELAMFERVAARGFDDIVVADSDVLIHIAPSGTRMADIAKGDLIVRARRQTLAFHDCDPNGCRCVRIAGRSADKKEAFPGEGERLAPAAVHFSRAEHGGHDRFRAGQGPGR